MCSPTRPQKRSAHFSKNAPFLRCARNRLAIRRSGSLSTGTAPITAHEKISTYASITEKSRCGSILRQVGSASAFFSWSDPDWNRGRALTNRARQRRQHLSSYSNQFRPTFPRRASICSETITASCRQKVLQSVLRVRIHLATPAVFKSCEDSIESRWMMVVNITAPCEKAGCAPEVPGSGSLEPNVPRLFDATCFLVVV